MSHNIRPAASAAGQPADSAGRDRTAEPPRTVNQLPVIDWRPKPARPGELPAQFYVICLRPDDEGERPYIVWTIAYDPGYQRGIWVAGNGRYDLTWERAQQVLDERAATVHPQAGRGSTSQEMSPATPPGTTGHVSAPAAWPEDQVIAPADGEQRQARAALTFLADPADPVLGALIRITSPSHILRCIKDGAIPAAVTSVLDQHGPALPRSVAAWRSRLGQIPSADDLAGYERRGIRLLCPGDPEWPAALDDLGDTCPYALWVRGDLNLRTCCTRSVAIVGSRAASGYGAHVAGQFAADLAARGWTVTSGAAYGIDAAAHRGALTIPDRGPTIAVLASGVSHPYPAGHRDLLGTIGGCGLVISEAPPDRAPTRLRFTVRNRIIADLAAGTVIVEAGLHSGTMTTARHALALGRPLMAVPGPVTSPQSAGGHHLIRTRQATCVTSAGDILGVVCASGEVTARQAGG
ncbi:MAG: DNA-protecting protein DprA [Streptosporangiaceae bacterium]|nr:DNA-protecting protein DprA [Streptosporangiaceae bacterium]